MRTPSKTVLLLCLTLSVAPAAFSQQTAPSVAEPERAPAGGFTMQIAGPDSLLGTFRYDPNEAARVIVRFASEPLSVVAAVGSGKAGLAAARTAIAAEHDQFLRDLARLDAASSGKGAAAPAPRVHAAFSVAFNGMALTVRRGLVDEISALGYVRRIHPDRQVRATAGAMSDDPSNRVTGVDQVRARFGATGKNITIAVLDTGIDYLHPDLGGGLGAGFRVIGGYDFVNDDADPMDDNGHGTHVAGIAAGSGAAHPGVAPDARLYAYKVLDANGNGHNSHIIAAIERAMDPNGDGSFEDAVDILNASLSGPGDADDPTSAAIDNATAAGVLCVVAAGNDSYYQAIGSPGSARNALTVGASDNADAIASFSSRGPSTGRLAIKPDVVAPGVAITAAWPGGGFQTLNGTSMATPHVAGAAALLLELHPQWSPEVIKAVFMGTAKDLGADAYTQGAGRVDVLAAAQAQTAALPGSISLGQIDGTVPTWTGGAPLTLANLGTTSQTYALTLDGALPPGLGVTMTPATVVVGAGQTAQVDVKMTVTNAQVPYRDPIPPAFSWRIVARSAVSEVRVPLNVLKSTSVQVDLADPLGFGYLSVIGEDKRYSQSFFPYVSGNPLLLPAGTYTFSAPIARVEGGIARPVFRVKRGVQVAGASSFAFEPAEAAHRIRLQPRDEAGHAVAADFTAYTLSIPSFIGPIASSGGVWGDFVYATLPAGPTLDLFTLSLRHGPAKQYVNTYRLSGGLTEAVTLENDPAQYRQITYRYPALPTTEPVWVLPGYFRQVGERGSFMTQSREFLDPRFPGTPEDLPEHAFRLGPPFERTVFLTPPAPGSPVRGVIDQVYLHLDAGAVPFTETPVARAEQDRMVTSRNRGGAFDGPQHIVLGKTLTLDVGVAPPYWASRLVRYNNALIGLDPAYFDVFYTNGMFDRPGARVHLEHFEGGERKAEHEVDNLLPSAFFEAGIGARIRARMGGYHVAEVPGTVTTDMQFDVAPVDPNPPHLTDFQLLSEGVVANRLRSDRTSTLRFALSTDPPIQKARLAYRRHGTAAWMPLATFTDAGPHEATLPDTLPAGFYDLQLYAEDRAAGVGKLGNWMAHHAEPAFVLDHRTPDANAAPTAARLQQPLDGTVVDFAANPVLPLRWAPATDADAGDRLSYTVRFYGPGLDTLLTAWTAPHLDLALPPALQNDATYRWTVTTSDGFAQIASPDTFRVQFGNTTAAEDDLVPTAFAFRPAFPNPSAGSITLPFDLAAATETVIEVYDLLGQRVAVLASGDLPAGQHRVEWNAGGVASGVYFCRMQAGGHVFTQKLVLVR